MVLVTGASGFLGRHLVRYLSAQGVTCRALYLTHPPSGELSMLPGIEWVKCDLLDIFAVEDAMEGVSELYHCAAIISFDARRHEEMLHFNLESTANLVNQALLQGIRKMVYVSSVAALGRPAVAAKEITEEEEWGESRYNSAYGISKYIAEMEVWRAIGEGLNAVIVNPGVILGEAETHTQTAKLMKLAQREFPFFTGGVTSWVDVTDVVTIMTKLMNSDIATERFIISSGNYSYREVLQMMAKALRKKTARYRAGKFVSGMAWRLSILRSALYGAEPVITKETANNANAVCNYNNSKLLNALPGFEYKPIGQAIAAMAQSFNESGKK